MPRVFTLFAMSVVTLSCGRSRLEDASVLSQRPVAVITPATITSPVGAPLTLNGESSYDPLGATVTYAWLITQRPTGSAAAFDAPTSGKPVLTPDLIGFWEGQLIVSAGTRVSDPVAVAITIVAVQLPVDAGAHPGVDAGVARVDGGVITAIDAGRPPPDAGSLQVLDPGEVYLMGTLSEGACYRDAVAHWSTPNVASVGFDCYADESAATIRPGNGGTLIYTNTFEDKLREYHCDDCSYSSPSTAYPANVLANDTVLPTPCPGANDRLAWFRVTAEGDALHQCNQSFGKLRDATGAIVYDGMASDPVIAVGGAGWLLTQKQIVNFKTGASVALKGLTPVPQLAMRWSPPDGFFYVNSGSVFSLYRASFTSGVSEVVAEYPAAPSGLTYQNSLRLDSSQRLFYFATLNGSFTDVIVRSEIGGESKVVYSEADHPLVKIHISSLVTGP